MDPRPASVVRLSPFRYRHLTRQLLADTKRCECGCGRPSETVHHVIGGNMRDDVPENMVCLAGDGTRLCHGAFTSKQRTWDYHRGVYISPILVAVGMRERMETERLDVLERVLRVKGSDWLDRVYPLVVELRSDEHLSP
jgi:hypothetical protein